MDRAQTNNARSRARVGDFLLAVVCSVRVVWHAMPPIRADPVVPHVFAKHDFAVRAPAMSADASVTATQKETALKELADLLPSRAAWKHAVTYTWSPDGASLLVHDQRAASHIAKLLRRHRVLRIGEYELSFKAGGEMANAETAAARLNMDEDLHAACAKRWSAAAGELGGPATVSNIADYVARHASFLGAYAADGTTASVVAAATYALAGIVSLADLVQLANHSSRYTRPVALLFARYAVPPEDYGAIFGLRSVAGPAAASGPVASASAGAVHDRTVVQFDDEGAQGPFREFARQLLTSDEVLEYWLPTYDPCVQSVLQQRLDACDQAPATTSAGSAAVAPGVAAAVDASTSAATDKPKKAAKGPKSLLGGFKSAAQLVDFARKAYELVETGATVSSRQMGHANIAVRKDGGGGAGDMVLIGSAADLALPSSGGGSAAAIAGPRGDASKGPQGVVAMSRKDHVLAQRQRRLDRMRGAVAATSVRAAAAGVRRDRRGAPTGPAVEIVAGQSRDAVAAAASAVTLWPTEIVGPMNVHGVIDDLMGSDAKRRVMFSATVRPDEVELAF